jgi:UDP-glucose 6-dehydrogenase
VDDVRESPAAEIMELLRDRGAPHRLFGRIESERIDFYSSRALLADARRREARALTGAMNSAAERAVGPPHGPRCGRKIRVVDGLPEWT